MKNSILLENIDSEGLKSLIREIIREERESIYPHKSDNKEVYLTRRETANKLHVSLVTLNAWSKTGRLKGYRVGGRVLYLESEIKDSLKQMITRIK
ncbi:MAG: helix-turn-helix domain-containing protein [Bacteroidales bacterium]|nr:helix-turn-helix domain-containing protein [Bacteroidales bacterium]